MSLSKIRRLGLCLVAAAALRADTPQIDSDSVRRVATHIACRCGACNETASCPMSMQGCGFCVPVKNKIVAMQKAGFDDQAIINFFKKQYGPSIYREGPNNFFWLIPYGSLLLGAGAIFWFVKRHRAPDAVPASSAPELDPVLEKYRAQMEKEVGDN